MMNALEVAFDLLYLDPDNYVARTAAEISSYIDEYVLKYNVKKNICDEKDDLIKRTMTYLNTFCKPCEPRKLLINLYNTRKQDL
jgi:hypothetical protein